MKDGILTTLEYGDAMWVGKGPKGDVDIGVERKTINDLINSIATGRLGGHQLPGMLEAYYKSYLIVEGGWREHRSGEIEVLGKRGWHRLDRGNRKFYYMGLWAFLNTWQVMTGVIVRTTVDMVGTARVIEGLWKWWQKDWEKHESIMQLYKKGPPTAVLRIGQPSLLRRIAAELPGIGWGRSLAVEKKFGSVEEMIMASEENWREIEGIGKITARNVWEVMR